MSRNFKNIPQKVAFFIQGPRHRNPWQDYRLWNLFRELRRFDYEYKIEYEDNFEEFQTTQVPRTLVPFRCLSADTLETDPRNKISVSSEYLKRVN